MICIYIGIRYLYRYHLICVYLLYILYISYNIYIYTTIFRAAVALLLTLWAVFPNPRHDDSFDLLGLDFSASAVPKTQVWKQWSLTMFVSLLVFFCCLMFYHVLFRMNIFNGIGTAGFYTLLPF